MDVYGTVQRFKWAQEAGYFVESTLKGDWKDLLLDEMDGTFGMVGGRLEWPSLPYWSINKSVDCILLQFKDDGTLYESQNIHIGVRFYSLGPIDQIPILGKVDAFKANSRWRSALTIRLKELIQNPKLVTEINSAIRQYSIGTLTQYDLYQLSVIEGFSTNTLIEQSQVWLSLKSKLDVGLGFLSPDHQNDRVEGYIRYIEHIIRDTTV